MVVEVPGGGLPRHRTSDICRRPYRHVRYTGQKVSVSLGGDHPVVLDHGVPHQVLEGRLRRKRKMDWSNHPNHGPGTGNQSLSPRGQT